MSIFDELRQKYNNLYYQGAAERNFNTLRNNLQNDILSNQFEDAREEYQGILSGTGFKSRSQDATRAGEQQQFTIDPITGQTILTTPEYMGGFRSDQTDFTPGGSSYQTGYDAGESNIDPVTGLPRPIIPDPTTGLVGQNTMNVAGRGGGREDRVSPTGPKGYDPYGMFNMATPNALTSTALGLIGAVTGIPTGLLTGISSGIAKQQLNSTYGINSNDIETINGFIEDGLSVEAAMDKFRETSEKHIIGRDLIGTGEIDPGFGLVSDDKLRELTIDAEDDFNNMFDDTDKPDSNNNNGGGLQPGYGDTEADDAREKYGKPTAPDNNNNNNNNNNGGGGTGGTTSGGGVNTGGGGFGGIHG